MSGTDKVKLLIVDDLPEKLLAYQTVLEELGQQMFTARSGAEALKLLLRHEFAVILLDVNMPEMDGFETARLIRQRKKSAHTPIIFLTAFVDEMRTAQGYAYGAVDYILSPVVPEILRAKIKVFVELFRMREQVAQQAEEQAKRAAAEAAARRSTFLVEAGTSLASSLDFDTCAHHLARLTVPMLADLGMVCLVDDEGRVRRAVSAWMDPEQNAVGTVPIERPALPGALVGAVERTLSAGKTGFLPEFVLSTHAAGAVSPKPRDTDSPLPDLHLNSAVILPLLAREQRLGALILALGPTGRGYGADELALATDLAGRAAVALDNARLYQELQAADRRKDEFLAMLAHELRNPLAPIRSAVEILRGRLSAEPQLDSIRAIIERQVMQLVRLVDDLLDVSRITRGKIQLRLDRLDLASVVASAVETSRPLILAHRHELTVALPPTPVWVKADLSRLAQALANLLNNAAKYTPDGGRIGLSVAPEGLEAVLRVRDTGAGIPPEMLAKIFDLFTQVDRSLDRAQGGLGIGLTLVRRLVELHGGSVQALSDGPARGAEFIVRLPLDADPGMPAATGAEANQTGAALGTRRRVLVVDDNRDAAESLALYLRLGGHEVRLAYDGPGALTAAEAFQPEVVLLDLGLPRLDGYEVARQLRTRPATRDAFLFAVSGYGQEEDRRRSQEAGFDQHWVKPVDLTLLQTLIASVSGQARGRRRG